MLTWVTYICIHAYASIIKNVFEDSNNGFIPPTIFQLVKEMLAQPHNCAQYYTLTLTLAVILTLASLAPNSDPNLSPRVLRESERSSVLVARAAK